MSYSSRRKERDLNDGDLRFNSPMYTGSEAASYLGVSRSTVTAWARPFWVCGARAEPLLTTLRGERLTIPFIGLAEGMVLAAFRQTGLPTKRVRGALPRLAKELGLNHALASQQFHTDGAELLFDHARSHGDKQLRLLTVVRAGRHVFHDVIERYLERIEYDGGWAARVALPITDERVLVADPNRSFGQPIFVHGAARLDDVIGRIEAGEDQGLVAEDFGVPIEHVRAALAAPIAAAA